MTDRLLDGFGRTSYHSPASWGNGTDRGRGSGGGSGSGNRNDRSGGRLVIAMLVSGLVLVLVMAAIVVIGPRLMQDKSDRPAFSSTGSWPATGQGAYQVVGDEIAVSGELPPAPIASLAKVMTAYVVLHHFPLKADDPGFRMTVTADDVADTARRRAQDESVVPLRVGAVLTERDALLALLLPSANNVAVMLARQVFGGIGAFVDDMNRTARELGMVRTTYTDPSGYDDGTVSTALDQLRLALVVARDDTLKTMMATRSAVISSIGTITNTDELLGSDGFVGMKTGSHDAAGGCFMFRAIRQVGGRQVEIIGVVMGQTGDDLIDAAFFSARKLVNRLALPEVDRLVSAN